MNKQNNMTEEFHDALRDSDITKMKALIAANKDIDIVNAQIYDGNTALIIAIQNDDLKSVEFLLEAGAKSNKYNKYGDLPLECAASHGNLKIIDALCKAGANARTENDLAQTPIDFAPKEIKEQVIDIFQKYDPDYSKWYAHEMRCREDLENALKEMESQPEDPEPVAANKKEAISPLLAKRKDYER